MLIFLLFFGKIFIHVLNTLFITLCHILHYLLAIICSYLLYPLFQFLNVSHGALLQFWALMSLYVQITIYFLYTLKRLGVYFMVTFLVLITKKSSLKV